MLLDLCRILVPADSSFIEALAKQPELQISGTGTTRASALIWKHALGYLYATKGYDRSDYVNSLIVYLTRSGHAQADILSAITRIAPTLGKILVAQLLPERRIDENDLVRANAAISGIQSAEESSQPKEQSTNVTTYTQAEAASQTGKTMPEPTTASNNTITQHVHRNDDVEESKEEIYIANAGLVLISPYMPQLFKMLDLTDGIKFIDDRAAERAIHLLQYVVNGSCDSPEFLLVLNKIMCGFVTGVPIIREIELLAKEKETVEGMLTAVIQRWSIIGNTSVQGLRETFLQRAGRLVLKEDNWHLKIEQKGVDVLIDRLPWSFSIIKHPWMKRPIYVEWRK